MREEDVEQLRCSLAQLWVDYKTFQFSTHTEIAVLRAELAAGKRIPHMDSLNPVLLAKSLEAVNAINTRLEAELAAEKAKVERGERFKKWLTDQFVQVVTDPDAANYPFGKECVDATIADWEADDDAAKHGEGGRDGK